MCSLIQKCSQAARDVVSISLEGGSYEEEDEEDLEMDLEKMGETAMLPLLPRRLIVAVKINERLRADRLRVDLMIIKPAMSIL